MNESDTHMTVTRTRSLAAERRWALYTVAGVRVARRIVRGGCSAHRAVFPDPFRPTLHPAAGTPLVVEYSKCSATPGRAIGWIACAAIDASEKP